MKNRYIHKIDPVEWQKGKAFMLSEVAHLTHTHPIAILLIQAIADFEAGKFSYDGATFVKERSKSLFEATAFIHDWRNEMGYIGYYIDQEMLDIMIVLNYNFSLIIWRYLYTRFTFLNILRHKILGNILRSKPTNIYKNTF